MLFRSGDGQVGNMAIMLKHLVPTRVQRVRLGAPKTCSFDSSHRCQRLKIALQRVAAWRKVLRFCLAILATWIQQRMLCIGLVAAARPTSERMPEKCVRMGGGRALSPLCGLNEALLQPSRRAAGPS